MDGMIEPKGEKFAKIFDRGWDTISGMADNATAVKVYAFIAKHCDHLNALVCPVEVLADEIGVSARTIIRATKFLEQRKHLVIVKVGTANAYVLDPRDIWKNYEKYKSMCVFTSRVMVSKEQNKTLKRRLTHYFGKPDQPDLLSDD